MSFMDKVKNWFARQERNSLQYDQRHEDFDEETDLWGPHKEHMKDRVDGVDESDVGGIHDDY
jgi:hypothetical protein